MYLRDGIAWTIVRSSSAFAAISLGFTIWVRFVRIHVAVFFVFVLSNHRGSHIPSSRMVHTGCLFVSGIHPSWTRISGSFEPVRWNAYEHTLDLGFYYHPKEFWGNGVRTHVDSKGKNPPRDKWGSIPILPLWMSTPFHEATEAVTVT